MIVVSRNMKVGKDISGSVIEDFAIPSAINKAEGFIRCELLVNREAEDTDIIKVLYYWSDKDALNKWHASKEHQQAHIDAHKERKAAGKEPINRKSLNLTFEEFDVVATFNPG